MCRFLQSQLFGNVIFISRKQHPQAQKAWPCRFQLARLFLAGLSAMIYLLAGLPASFWQACPSCSTFWQACPSCSTFWRACPPLSGGIFLKWLIRLDAFKLCSFKSLSKDFFEDIHVHIAEGLNIEASFTCFVFSQFGKLIFNRLQSAH